MDEFNPDDIASSHGFNMQYHDIDGVRFYSILDWVRGVAQSSNASRFWVDMKTRIVERGITDAVPVEKHAYARTDGRVFRAEFTTSKGLNTITHQMSLDMGIVAKLRINSDVLARPRGNGGYVYLLSSPTGAMKIGRARNPKNRLKTFGVLLPFEVEFIALIPADDMHALERELHNLFAHKRVNGEWFNLLPDDVEYIKSLAAQS